MKVPVGFSSKGVETFFHANSKTNLGKNMLNVVRNIFHHTHNIIIQPHNWLIDPEGIQFVHVHYPLEFGSKIHHSGQASSFHLPRVFYDILFLTRSV